MPRQTSTHHHCYHPRAGDDVTFSPFEVSEFNEHKCTVTSRTLQFFLEMLSHHRDDVMKVTSKNLWKSLIDLCVAAAVSPMTSLGYNTSDEAIARQLTTLVCELMVAMVNTFSPSGELVSRLIDGLRRKLATTKQ